MIRRAKITGSTLRGRLYLKGYGDPTARVGDYASLARQVRAAGIRTVAGKLVVDVPGGTGRQEAQDHHHAGGRRVLPHHREQDRHRKEG